MILHTHLIRFYKRMQNQRKNYISYKRLNDRIKKQTYYQNIKKNHFIKQYFKLLPAALVKW